MSNPKFTSVKLNVVSAILSEIFKPYQGYLETFLDKIVKDNAEISNHPNSMMGFTFGYKPYYKSGINNLSSKLPKLEAVLEPIFADYSNALDSYAKDFRRVNQGLGTLFARGESMQDFYDLLPDEVHSILGQSLSTYFGGLTRTRPEAYAIKDNPVQYEAFLHQKELIFQYIGNHLIV